MKKPNVYLIITLILVLGLLAGGCYQYLNEELKKVRHEQPAPGPQPADPAESVEAVEPVQPAAQIRVTEPEPEPEPVPRPEINIGKADVFVRSGHQKDVTSVAISPDGRFAISGSQDKTLRVWDVNTGREIRVIRGHSKPITSVAISPDGLFALSGSQDRTLILWEIGTGQKIRSFKGNLFPVTSVVFSPDGRFALSGSNYKVFKLWDIETGQEVRAYEGHKSRVFSVAISPDGEKALSGSHDKTVCLWSLRTGKKLRTFKGHSDDINAVAFSPDGNLALSGSDDRTIRLWDISGGRRIRTFHGHTAGISAVAFSPNGLYAISGSYDKTLRLWDVETGQDIRIFRGHSGVVRSVAYGPDGKFALSGGNDHTLRLWDTDTGREIHTFKGYAKPVTATAFSPDGRFMLSGSSDNTLRLWSASRGREIHLFRGHSERITSAAFSPDGQYALSGSYDDTLKLWDVETGRDIRTFRGHSDNVNTVAFSPDGQYALSGSYDNTLRLWDIATGQRLRFFSGHSYSVTSAAFSPDGRYALSGSYDRTMRLWDVNAGYEIRSFRGHKEAVSSVAFSPDGQYALSGSHDKTLKLWDVETGREIRKFKGHPGQVTAAAFSPYGESVLSADDSGILVLWERDTGRVTRVFRHGYPIRSACFSPDQRFAISGGKDCAMRLWNTYTGNEIIRMFGFSDGEWITMTPEGFYNASVNGGKHLNLKVGGEVYHIGQYEAVRRRPEIIVQALKTGYTKDAIAGAFREVPPVKLADACPPRVSFISALDRHITDMPYIEVRVRADEVADPADSVTFRVNHRPVLREETSKHFATPNGVFREFSGQVPLVVGENWIEARVRGSSGATGITRPIRVTRRGNLHHLPKLWYFGVGISEHELPELCLSAPARDVSELAGILQKQEGIIYSEVNTRVLTDHEGTRDHIIEVLETFFKRAAQRDVVILFVAGHIMNDASGCWFVCSDAHPDALSSTGVSWKTFNDSLKRLTANVLLLTDTCHAGEIHGNEEWRAKARVDPNDFLWHSVRNGAMVFSSGPFGAISEGRTNQENGIFAQALRDGLNGKAVNPKGVVSLSSLKMYVQKTFRELTKNTYEPVMPKPAGAGAFLDPVLAAGTFF